MKVTSSRHPNDPRYIKTLSPDHTEVAMGDCAEDGSQLRPFIVWFGEAVPEIDRAVEACAKAELLIVIGTSLNVYPAAGLTRCVPPGTPIYLIDPKPVAWNSDEQMHHIMKGASEGMKELLKIKNIGF
jgi:NAD-dependent deacetylase